MTKAALIKARDKWDEIGAAGCIFELGEHAITIRDLLDKAIGGESKTGVGPQSTEHSAPYKPAICRECYRYLGDPVVCPGCMAYRDHQS